jgi:lysophospholipase L1-like esterase
MFETFCKGEDDFETHLYTSDLLHLSAAGYQAWAETMAPVFNEMMES